MPDNDPPKDKKCSKCRQVKPSSEFRTNRADCRVCSNKTSNEARTRRTANPKSDTPPPRAPRPTEPVNSKRRTRFPSLDAFEALPEHLRDDPDEVLARTIIEGGRPLISFSDGYAREIANAVLTAGSFTAAVAAGLNPTVVRGYLQEVHRNAARRGYSPAHDMGATVPEGFSVKGVSTFYSIDEETGEARVRGQWVKTKSDEDHKYAMLIDALARVAPAWDRLADPVALPPVVDDDLLCVYPMGDPHLGMLAWAAETGKDFDLAIAERNLCTAMEQLVAGAPRAKHALIIDLGDFFHADNAFGTTTAGTRVDVDTRWSKLMAAGVRAARRCIDLALAKHEIVTAIIEIGNHDSHASVMLAIALSQYYEREPRVRIDTSPAKFHFYRFGKTLIGVTHGDTCKPADLLGVMACDRKEDWGETEYRYWYTGHVHHTSVKEFPGMIVETFRTLASSDAWHKSKGYRSGQEAVVDVIHVEFGKLTRNTVGIRRIEHALKEAA